MTKNIGYTKYRKELKQRLSTINTLVDHEIEDIYYKNRESNIKSLSDGQITENRNDYRNPNHEGKMKDLQQLREQTS